MSIAIFDATRDSCDFSGPGVACGRQDLFHAPNHEEHEAGGWSRKPAVATKGVRRRQHRRPPIRSRASFARVSHGRLGHEKATMGRAGIALRRMGKMPVLRNAAGTASTSTAAGSGGICGSRGSTWCVAGPYGTFGTEGRATPKSRPPVRRAKWAPGRPFPGGPIVLGTCATYQLRPRSTCVCTCCRADVFCLPTGTQPVPARGRGSSCYCWRCRARS